MTWVIDRFEEKLAVMEAVESGESILCLVVDLPEGAKEGDVFVEMNGRFVQDSKERVVRVNRIREKMERLKKK